MRDVPETIKQAEAILDAARLDHAKAQEAIERLDGLQTDQAEWLESSLLTASLDEVALVLSRSGAVAAKLGAHEAEASRLEADLKIASTDLAHLESQRVRLEGSIANLEDRNVALRLSPNQRRDMLKRDRAQMAALTA